MPTRYNVRTKSRLNGDGVWGAWLLILSPLGQALGWFWYVREPTFWALALAAVATMAFLSGFVLLMIGRDYDSIVDERTH